jgi:hypothetical protein
VGDYLVRITEDAEFDSYANLDEAAIQILGAISGSVFGSGFGDDDETRFLTLLVRADDLDALEGPLMITLPEGVVVAEIIEV